jgi:hypothetical protein
VKSGPVEVAKAPFPRVPRGGPRSLKSLREQRIRALVKGYTADVSPLGAAELALAHAVAMATLQLDDMRAALTTGQTMSASAMRMFTRLSNTSARLLRELRAKAKPVARGDAPSVPSLGDHLARLSQRKSLNGLANSLQN